MATDIAYLGLAGVKRSELGFTGLIQYWALLSRPVLVRHKNTRSLMERSTQTGKTVS